MTTSISPFARQLSKPALDVLWGARRATTTSPMSLHLLSNHGLEEAVSVATARASRDLVGRATRTRIWVLVPRASSASTRRLRSCDRLGRGPLAAPLRPASQASPGGHTRPARRVARPLACGPNRLASGTPDVLKTQRPAAFDRSSVDSTSSVRGPSRHRPEKRPRRSYRRNLSLDRSKARGGVRRPSAEEVAPELIGVTLLVHGVGGRIVEIQAYNRSEPAKSSVRGPTPSTKSLFGQ
jgi:Methylpurine-DNA glycosylase (MPG)